MALNSALNGAVRELRNSGGVAGGGHISPCYEQYQFTIYVAAYL